MGLELTEAENWQAAQPIRMKDLPDCLPDSKKRKVNGGVVYKTAEIIKTSMKKH